MIGLKLIIQEISDNKNPCPLPGIGKGAGGWVRIISDFRQSKE
jgi:hypothetical protein